MATEIILRRPPPTSPRGSTALSGISAVASEAMGMEAKEIPPPYRLSLYFGVTAVSISRAVRDWVDSVPRPPSRPEAICRIPVPEIGTEVCRDLERELKKPRGGRFQESEKNIRVEAKNIETCVVVVVGMCVSGT